MYDQRKGQKRKLNIEDMPGPSGLQALSHFKKERAQSECDSQGISLENLQPTYMPLGIRGDEFRYFMPQSPDSMSGFIESRRSQCEFGECPEDFEPISNIFEDINSGPDESDSESESASEDVTMPFQFLQIVPKEKSDDKEKSRSQPVFIPKINFDFACRNPGQTKIPFNGTPGLRLDCPEKPIDFFRLIANDIFMECIIAKINAYAENLKLSAAESPKKSPKESPKNSAKESPQDCPKGSPKKNPKKSPRRSPTRSPRERKPRIMCWKPLTLEEFEKFLALIFLMGQIKAPDIFWYWKRSRIYHFPIFANVLSRDRFLDILRIFHINRNFGEDESIDDPSDELKPIDIFNNNMKEIYYPEKEFTIDKFVISPRGLHIREDDTEKYKFGIKIYTLSELSGLVLKIHTHMRLKKRDNNVNSDEIIHELLSDFQGKGHVIFLDETFVNYPLAKSLLKKKTHTLGMLGKFKIDNPFGVISVQLRKNEVIQQFSPEGICVMRYRYKGTVWMMLSSEREATMRTVTVRKKQIEKPQIFIDYNSVMNSERTEKFLKYYPCDQRLPGWPTKLAIHIFHIIMYNSYILFNQCHPNKLKPEEFRERMIEAWLKMEPSVAFKSSFLQLDLESHRVHVPRLNERVKERKRCVVCHKEQIRQESRYYCPDCPDKPGLCIDRCFRKYHNY